MNSLLFGLKLSNLRAPAFVFLLVFALLIPVQILPEKILLLFERLFSGGGWLQITIVSSYAAILMYNMQFRERRAKWRERSWLFFACFFYFQLILGISADSLFLLSGKLHIPIPAIIIAGPVFRFSSWFMIILFISTIIFTGPAWCSHLCYFGAFDSVSSHKSAKNERAGSIVLGKKKRVIIKFSILLILTATALVLRIMNGSNNLATLLAVLFGMIGIGIILTVSRKTGSMHHCTLYCPVGTIVNYAKYLSPFHFEINSKCTACCSCISKCRYMALSVESVKMKKIENTCTYCGDCLTSCKHNALQYRFLRLSSEGAERLWLILTITIHAVFVAVARV